MRTLAQVILVRHDGSVILQPEHSHSGADAYSHAAAIGGSLTTNETPLEAAHRWLNHQTNLTVKPEQLVFWRRYALYNDDREPSDRIYYFVVHHIPAHRLRLANHHHPVIVHHHRDSLRLNLPGTLRQAITDYFQESSLAFRPNIQPRTHHPKIPQADQ